MPAAHTRTGEDEVKQDMRRARAGARTAIHMSVVARAQGYLCVCIKKSRRA